LNSWSAFWSARPSLATRATLLSISSKPRTIPIASLAVAGFAEEDLAITIEDKQLVIRGRQSDDSEERVFLHRGIAARQFQRSFVLADGVEVGEALIENGLLHIDLTRAEPEQVVQTIKIKSGKK